MCYLCSVFKMETCDISLVKQEIVELIKTEPQNEDEFDMCGQSGIKTKDSNMMGDFKDTITYETKSFQTSDVEMKSPWDGFLPIKEEIKFKIETCDISLVNQEIIELIKTEPQNEDELDTCGQSGIKTEDSNLAGDFKDTINYEAQSFQTSDVEMKSPWDGFLPIKEQIKDESDTSNFVDEIVKTEIKLYDSSFGIMDSNIDHFTPVDKSKEDIVLHMEEDINVKPRIVQRVLRHEDIVKHMEE
uniref:Uncharacterized protein n=1 Tax=Timema cristinae TaxID=61476 RepID=A0A7R9CT25_TIMCR|nr:unnamed protein product [Timema cristinae]